MSKIKSKAQLRRLQLLHVDGKLTTEELKRYTANISDDLPERIEKKPRDPNKWPSKERWPRRGK